MKIEKNHVKHNPEITQSILDDMSDAIGKSYSPTGASTLMIQAVPGQDGSSTANVRTHVSKDGSSILSSVVYDNATCMALKRLVVSTMAGVLQTAADGTTTTTLLLAELYRQIRETDFFKTSNIPAQLLQDLISEVVEDIVAVVKSVVANNVTTIDDVHGIVKTTVNADKELYSVISAAINEMLEKGCSIKNLAFRFEADLASGKSSYVVDTGYAVPDAVLGANLFGGFTKDNCTIVMIDRSVQTGEQVRSIIKTMSDIAEVQLQDSYVGRTIRPCIFITEDIKYKNVFIQEYHKFMARMGENHNFTPSVFILEFRADGSVYSRDEHDDFIQLLGQSINYELFEDYNNLFDIPLKEGEQPVKVSDFIVEKYTADKLAKGTVTIGKTSTIIKDVKTIGDNVLLTTRIDYLKEQVATELNLEKKNEFKARLSKLDGYYALVKIASDNEWDVRRKLDAVEDAVGAVKAVVNSSAVGGMSTLIPKIIKNHMASYNCSTPEGIMKNQLVEAIFISYKKLYSIIMANSGADAEAYFEDLMKFDCAEVDFIKRSVDVYKVLNSFRNGKKDFTDVKTFEVLNSSDAEIKILEATSKAASTLLGINQICLPDKYDAGAYENGSSL